MHGSWLCKNLEHCRFDIHEDGVWLGILKSQNKKPKTTIITSSSIMKVLETTTQFDYFALLNKQGFIIVPMYATGIHHYASTLLRDDRWF